MNSSKFFIEIGSSDFDTLLPLSENGWEGIIVEPIPELIERLEPNENVVFENCAISTTNEEVDIQYYDPAWAKGWTRGVGSISDVNHFNMNPQWDEHVFKKRVPCMTLANLIEKHDVKKIDYLKIDTEGTEFSIANSYDWRIIPKFLKIEHRHWEAHDVDVDEYVSLFKKMKYIVYKEENDLYCIQ